MSLLDQLRAMKTGGTDSSFVLVDHGQSMGLAKLGARGNFGGHNVQALPGHQQTVGGRSKFEQALVDRYGQHIVDQLKQDSDKWGVGNQPLTLRRAVRLEGQARELQLEINKDNLHNGRSLMLRHFNSVAQQFQDTIGVTKPLSKQEKNAILQHAAQKMLSDPAMHQRPLTRGDVEAFLHDAVQEHYMLKAKVLHEGMQHLHLHDGHQPGQVGNIGVVELEQMLGELSNLPEDEQELSKTAIGLLAAGNSLLGECPVSQDEVQSLTGEGQRTILELQQQRAEIDNLRQQLSLTGEVLSDTLGALDLELQDMIGKITTHLQYTQSFVAKDPTSKPNLEKGVWYHSRAALLAIDDLMQKYPGHAPGLLQLRQQIEQHSDLRLQNVDTQPVDNIEHYIEQGRDEINDMLAQGLAQLGVEENAPNLIKHKGAEALNRFASFDPIHEQYEFRSGEKVTTVTSDITPARNLPALQGLYQMHGIRGVSSGSSKESRHAVNLAVTKATVGGNVVFEGIRHGVLSAFGVPKGIIATIKSWFTGSDPDARKVANRNRAMEVVTAATGTLDPAKLRQAIQSGQPVDLSIGSIGLLTPDNTRRFLDFISNGKAFGDANEFEQMNDQFQAWKDVEGVQTVMVEHPDNPGQLVPIQVRVDTMAFNFGVNEGAVKGKFGFDSSWRHTGGWQNVKDQNKVAMEKLMGTDLSNESAPIGGKLKAYLDDPHVLDSDKAIARELATQIRFMWNNESYMEQGGEPYKMVARLAVLTHMMGIKCCFNCKSGKDRTGMLDSHAKHLATQIAVEGRVPALGILPDERGKFNERQAVLRGGSLKMQEYNVGLGGYKLNKVDDNFFRIGGSGRKKDQVVNPGIMRAIEGGSDLVKE